MATTSGVSVVIFITYIDKIWTHWIDLHLVHMDCNELVQSITNITKITHSQVSHKVVYIYIFGLNFFVSVTNKAITLHMLWYLVFTLWWHAQTENIQEHTNINLKMYYHLIIWSTRILTRWKWWLMNTDLHVYIKTNS